MTMRKPSISERDVESLLRDSPPIERAPSWLRASTMDRIARSHKPIDHNRPARDNTPPSTLRGATLLLRLAPLAAAAAILAIAGLVILPTLRAPSAPPRIAIIPDTHPDKPAPDLSSPVTLEAFKTLRTLARRPGIQPEAVVRNRVEAPLLREARLVAQDSENVARAVLARLPIPTTLP